MTTMLVILPAIWERTTQSCLDSMLAAKSSLGMPRDELLVVDNSRAGAIADTAPTLWPGVRVYRDPDGHNLGVAGAWNVGAREVVDRGLDWLVICSTSMLFGPELHTTFRREVEAHPEAQIVECMGNSWHLIAIARWTLEAVGLFDENFYPAYEESIDWGYRQKLLGLEAKGWPRVWCNAMSVGAAMHVDRSKWDAPSGNGPALLRYYEQKWGGPKGQERFTTPFGLGGPLDEWPEVSVPELAERYKLDVWW